MKTLYAACIARLGLSHAGAAALHNVRLDTIRSWCIGRNRVPDGAWDELRAHEARIVDASEAMREAWEAAGSPPIEIDTSEAGDMALIAAADFVLGATGPVRNGRTDATVMAPGRQNSN